MTRNQLPEGVGKKIVEALKRQAEADISPLSENENLISESVPLDDIRNLPDINLENTDEFSDNNTIIEEDTEEMHVLPSGVIKRNDADVQPQNMQNAGAAPQEQPSWQTSALQPQQPQIEIREVLQPQTPAFQSNAAQNYTESITKSEKRGAVSIPANVAVLKNLIASLPVGVTKQTGAQIIRQTLEAMGIPMNGVLKEAQEVQEELNSSTRECMLKIQEYKTNILQLEQSVQEYQRNITQINDLVSLFLSTDRK